MHIRLTIDPSRVWSWHARLIAALAADGHRVDIAHAPEADRRPLPRAYSLLEALEKIIARGPELLSAARASADALQAPVVAATDPYDLSLDLSFGDAASGGGRDLSLRYDGGDENGAMLALCEGRIPVLSLRDRADRALFAALPAIEKPHALGRALEHLFSRALTLCRAAPGRVARGETLANDAIPIPTGSSRPFAAAAASLAAKAISLKLRKLVETAPRWRTGFRIAAGDRVIETGRWPSTSYAMLADDGKRFFADPFPFWHDGVCHVLVEEYPFATGKGVISAFALDAQDKASAPRVVLERPYHLSYPMIFTRDGAIWMIPETSNARSIELYRADTFPDRWVFERTLVEGARASDMTLTEHGGKLWLLGTIAEEGGSTWDGLCAYFADDLLGEWRPHSLNPLLIDASCARPAGMTVNTSAGLIRPVQDCRGRYGAALALARIDRLDEAGFSQSVIARLSPDPRWSAVGAHTVNEAGGVECVDWIAATP